MAKTPFWFLSKFDSSKYGFSCVKVKLNSHIYNNNNNNFMPTSGYSSTRTKRHSFISNTHDRHSSSGNKCIHIYPMIIFKFSFTSNTCMDIHVIATKGYSSDGNKSIYIP